MNSLVAAELPRIRMACYLVAVAGLSLAVFSGVVLAFVFVREQGTPQFPYAVVIGICSLVYFLGVAIRSLGAVRLSRVESSLSQAMRYFAEGVISFFLPLTLFVVWLIWTFFQPIY
jgi:hypothetical protein